MLYEEEGELTSVEGFGSLVGSLAHLLVIRGLLHEVQDLGRQLCGLKT